MILKNLKFKQPKILVIGDLMIDHYMWGKCERISPEAPVQIIDVVKENNILGGAGNVIHNLHEFNAKVGVISVIGKDSIGKKIEKMLNKLNVKTYLNFQNGRKTSRKSRVIASNQQVVRVDKESKDDISQKSQKNIFKIFKKRLENYDIVLLSDYGKGVLTSNLTKKLIKFANKKNKKVLIDPKGADFSKYEGAYLLTPNKKEAILASKIEITDEKSLKIALKKLKKEIKLKVSLITLSEDGIALWKDKFKIFPTVAKEVFDVTGAGDTVLASIGFALACGESLDNAIKFANLSAGVVVGKIGSATASIDEIEEYSSTLNKSQSDSHIKNWDEIERIVKNLKSRGKRIVFTNGCFDILHIGHVKYLEIAKSFGDILIVGLNSDLSVKELKGETRPINPQYDRAYLLASLEAVDFVVAFKEQTPYDLISKIMPDTLVKGGDYKGKKIVGDDLAKEVRLVNFIDGKSTSKIIEKIEGKNL